MINWIPAETAPKDGSLILASFKGHPTTAAVWNECEKQWAIASLQCNLYNGKWDDWYFETEYFSDSELKSWAEIK